VFDILVTMIGSLADEAAAQAFARDLEVHVARAHDLGLIVEIRDDRVARVIRKHVAVPRPLHGASDEPLPPASARDPARRP
jgi:hypothetical protein